MLLWVWVCCSYCGCIAVSVGVLQLLWESCCKCGCVAVKVGAAVGVVVL